jgi:hypothetical protein
VELGLWHEGGTWTEGVGEPKRYNEELHNMYSSRNIIRMMKSRRMRWDWHVAQMGERRNAYRTLVAKPEEKRRLGRPRRTWVDNIEMEFRQI